MDLAERIMNEITQRLHNGESVADITQGVQAILEEEGRNNPAQVSALEFDGFYDVALRVEVRVTGADTPEIAEAFVRKWLGEMPCDPDEADRIAGMEVLDTDDETESDLSVGSVSVPATRCIA